VTTSVLSVMTPGLSATSEPRGTSGIDRRPKLARYLAAAIVTVVFVGGNLNVLVSVLALPISALAGAYGVASAIAIVAIQLLHFSRQSTKPDSRRSRLMLALQACLAFPPLIVFGVAWIGEISFVAGSVLLVLRPRYAWPVFAVVVASITGVLLLLDLPGTSTVYGTINVAYYGLVIFLLTRLARIVTDLHQARTELALRAVAEQRLAFARDLHDLLGLSLSAIALKGELVHRQLRRSADLAREGLAEITGIAQRTLSDVRSVARGYRELSLEKESRAAESLLAASDISVRVHLDEGDLPMQTRTMLSKALRAGVSNVLRYQDVERCEIAVLVEDGQVTLDIENDGDEDDLLRDETALATLADEVRLLGGKLATAPSADGRHRLHLELPLAGDLPAAKPAAAGDPAAESRSTSLLLTLVFVLLAGQSVVYEVSLTSGVWEAVFGIGPLLALLVLQLSYFNRPTTRLRSPQSYGLLFVQACLVYLPVIPLRHHWATMPGLLVGCALLVMPPPLGWAVFVLCNASFVWIQVWLGTSPVFVLFFGTAAVLSSVVVFSLLWQVRLIAELDHTRKRLAEIAVADERLRFARDLHDLLGMSLSAIALKSELTSRILSIDLDRATEELQEVLGLTRQALSDVRSVASGNRELSLESESRSAENVLAAADVQVRMEMLDEDLPAQVRTVLAVVLREGVTNVLRHSNVAVCEIALRRTSDGVELDIVNDGVETEAERARVIETSPGNGSAGDGRPRDNSGSGIGNMSHRVHTLGGDLTAGLEADGRFRLRAVVPA
jgi:signal transduction histidine kinase